MRTIGEFFTADAPQTLFHYTGIGALLGIADRKKVWASNVYYLNDSREVLHACNVLNEHIGNLLSNDAYHDVADFLVELREWIGACTHTHYNIFVFSLSEQRNLLSQWRSYTPHGKGVSLGFAPRTIRAIAESSNCVLAKCLYTRSEHVQLAEALVEKILQTFRRLKDFIDTDARPATQKYRSFLEDFRGAVLQALCIIKHSAFSEEQEWRLISPYIAQYTNPKIRYREGASMLIPYIELDLPSETKLFDEVRLGPSEHRELSMSALTQFLSNKGLKTEVTISTDIPYREWSKR